MANTSSNEEAPNATGESAEQKPGAEPADKKAVEPVREALEKALAEVDSPEKAEQVIHDLQTAAAEQTAEDIQKAEPPPGTPSQAAQQVEEASRAAPAGQKAQTAISETARVVTTSEGAEREALSQAAQDVFNPEQQDGPASASKPQRDYLRDALFGQLKPLDALDAKLFMKINGLPHTNALNNFFYDVTTAFTAGAAWYALMGIVTLRDPKFGLNVIRQSALPLIIASALVELPIKSYFRRKRPFISIVQAIVIGKKPGTWSFPSGHSAVAFAGAWLLSQHFPRQRGLLYTVAGMVAFSRVYLGDHYPGDVVAGSSLGVVFAMAARTVLGSVLGRGRKR